jgi:hypothetical protein
MREKYRALRAKQVKMPMSKVLNDCSYKKNLKKDLSIGNLPIT